MVKVCKVSGLKDEVNYQLATKLSVNGIAYFRDGGMYRGPLQRIAIFLLSLFPALGAKCRLVHSTTYHIQRGRVKNTL